MWLYDVTDLAAAYAGTKQPWEVVPYAHGRLTSLEGYPFIVKPGVWGVGYDSATKRIVIGTTAGAAAQTIFHVITHP